MGTLRRSTTATIAAAVVVACSVAPLETDDTSASQASALSRLDKKPLPAPSTRSFVIRALGNRCWDIGGRGSAVGAPVVIRTCTPRATRQMFRVDELDASHDVQLVADGGLCVGVQGGAVGVGAALELQTCIGSPAQRFAYDGDAILVGRQKIGGRVSREYVVEPHGANTNEGSAVVVATRELSDAEYWRMIAADGSSTKPTTGFVSAATYPELEAQLRAATWGTVIELSARASVIDVDQVHCGERNVVKEGVTLRSSRRFLDDGVELHLSPAITFPGVNDACFANDHWAFAVRNQGRITGLRLRGPGNVAKPVSGVIIEHEYAGGGRTESAFVDHVEAYDWNNAGVDVVGEWFGTKSVPLPDGGAEEVPQDAECNSRYHRAPFGHIVASFIHHNVIDQGAHYGVAVGYGGYASVRRTLMFDNAHEIASDGIGMSRYDALENLFTSYMRRDENMNQEIDVHGRCTPGSWVGGRAGDFFDVGYNTFLAWRDILNVRGRPCRYASFHDNVTSQPASRVRASNPIDVPDACAVSMPSASTPVIVQEHNQFEYADATRQWLLPPNAASHALGDVAVGDFDGDGIDDVFLGTGVTWWFSSGGKAEWRFLNRMPERASQLRFGDFDGDGRTDVMSIDAGWVRISWGGGSPWFYVTPIGTNTIANVAVGDFDGDRVADLFVTDGTTWSWAPRARTFQYFATSGYLASNLRFGNFVESWRTNVLGYVSGRWRVVRGPNMTWEDLGPAFDTNVGSLVAADFDGNGATDLAKTVTTGTGAKWVVSWGARTSFTDFASVTIADVLAFLPVGQFDGQPGPDVLVWRDSDFPSSCIGCGSANDGRPASVFAKYSAGHLTHARWSRQTMR